jgi:hypothetical protein
MNSANAASFVQLALGNPELRQKALTAAQSGDAVAVEQLAEEAGTPATFAEIMEACRLGVPDEAGSLAETELSDEELETVAGGAKLKFGSSAETH